MVINGMMLGSYQQPTYYSLLQLLRRHYLLELLNRSAMIHTRYAHLMFCYRAGAVISTSLVYIP